MTTDPNVTGQPPEPAAAPTAYQQVATVVVTDLEKIVEEIPNLASGIPPAVSKFIRGHLSVPNGFLSSALATVEQSDAIQGTKLFDADAQREAIQYIEAFQPVANRIYSLGDALAYTIWQKKASAAASSLRVYGIAKQIALIGGDAVTAGHVSAMKKELGRKGPRAKKPQTQTPQTPSPTGSAS